MIWFQIRWLMNVTYEAMYIYLYVELEIRNLEDFYDCCIGMDAEAFHADESWYFLGIPILQWRLRQNVCRKALTISLSFHSRWAISDSSGLDMLDSVQSIAFVGFDSYLLAGMDWKEIRQNM